MSALPAELAPILVQAQGLGLSYGEGQSRVNALQEVSFDIRERESLAITGPSGSGKSTLLALLGGFLSPTSGDCRVAGQSLRDMSDAEQSRYRAESLGFVFQQFCLLPHLSLMDNLLLGVDHLPKQRAAWTDRARDLLGSVGLAGLHNRRPNEVSGGQAQRAAIARALLRRPRLLLADEPTGSLDAATTDEVMDLLASVCEEGCALVVVTHSEAVAARMPRRLRLAAGRLVDDSDRTGAEHRPDEALGSQPG